MPFYSLGSPDCSVDKGQFKVIKCFNLQSALDILNRLFKSSLCVPVFLFFSFFFASMQYCMCCMKHHSPVTS